MADAVTRLSDRAYLGDGPPVKTETPGHVLAARPEGTGLSLDES